MCILSLEAQPSGEESLAIRDNIAGKLATRIGDAKMSIKNLTVSGKLNGTDVAVIRDMAREGFLADLDLKNANIVDGGEPYLAFPAGAHSYYTANNVIGSFMFVGCEKLESLKLPSSVKRIESSAIYNNRNLKEIVLPSLCEYIGNNAIYWCDSLKTVTIPANVSYIGFGNFQYCRSFQGVKVDPLNKNYKSVGGMLFSYSGKTLISHYDRSFLMKITLYGSDGDGQYKRFVDSYYSIPEGTDTIGRGAFYGSNLPAIGLNKDLKVIEALAFESSHINKINSSIDDIKQVDIDSTAFKNISDTCTWIVPQGSVATYKDCRWWNKSWRISDYDKEMEKLQDELMNTNTYIGTLDIKDD